MIINPREMVDIRKAACILRENGYGILAEHLRYVANFMEAEDEWEKIPREVRRCMVERSP